jgi:hypothetical protein
MTSDTMDIDPDLLTDNPNSTMGTETILEKAFPPLVKGPAGHQV